MDAAVSNALGEVFSMKKLRAENPAWMLDFQPSSIHLLL